MSNELIGVLKELNSKERFWLLWNMIGEKSDEHLAARNFNPEGKFELAKPFRTLLKEKLGLAVDVPATAFWAMDYHIDWLWGAKNATQGKCKCDDGYKGQQEDIDLIVAFEDRDSSKTHLVLIEAKGVTSWSNKQARRKARRLRNIFGEEGNEWIGVQPYYVLMSPKESSNVDVKDWPEWTKTHNGKPRYWIDLTVPADLKMVTRCDGKGNSSKSGRYVTLRNRKQREPQDRTAGGDSAVYCAVGGSD